MGGNKRQLEQDDISNHKRRKPYSADEINLAKVYNDLADEVEQVRLKAASELIKHITASESDRDNTIDIALTRLIKGVGSGRKAARLGFSVALTEVLRLALQGHHSLKDVTARIVKLTAVEGNASGSEKRDAALGRQFAFQAVLQTGSKTIASVTAEDWRTFLNAVADLASQRQWLRKQCGLMLYEFVSQHSKELENQYLQALVDAWSEKILWKTPEGVALWLELASIDSVKLPKHMWHHQNPLSSKERSVLAKVMQEVPTEDDGNQQKAGTRQVMPSYAWTVVLNSLLDQDTTKDFTRFWEAAVSRGLFATTSSNERKAFGFQIVTLGLRLAKPANIDHILSPEIIRCMFNHRTSPERYLFEAAKAPLNAITARSKAEPAVSARVLAPLLQYCGVNFDHATKTKTVETLLAQADPEALQELQVLLQNLILKQGNDAAQAESRRRTIADLMVSTLRSRREESELFITSSGYQQLSPWVLHLLKTLLSAAFESEASTEYEPSIAPASRTVFRARLMSCIGHLLNFPVELACLGPNFVLSELESQKALHRSKKNEEELMKRAGKVRRSISNGAIQGLGNSLSTSHALHLLLSMTMLQVYSEEADSVSALEDLLMSIESWESTSESKTILLEIIISFVSKPSALYKKLAEQVFGAVATSMTADSLRSMLDILEQKESASGQQELFDQEDEMQEDQQSDDDDDNNEDAVDVEDDSDVEIVNGVVTANDSDSEDNSDETSSSVDDGDEDEEAAFDRKLADALGTAGMDEDAEDDDGSDMDDEQMMALEPHLANIFKERQKQASTKQDNKDARENIINFKNRILDLLGIYVKRQYSSPDAVEIIHPLIVLIRTTSSKPTSEKAFAVLKQYFEAYSKNKPEPPTQDGNVLFSLLSVIHAEVSEGGSKLHTSACSRSSLFIAKLLIGIDPNHYQAIAERYAQLQSEWYSNPKSKIQSSMFTEWTSWSITTRKR